MSKKLPRLLKCLSISLYGLATTVQTAPEVPAAVSNDWRLSLPGWKYTFPADHGSHPYFKTEWWYFTGNLKSENGREFGYQLTFFRQGVRPPSDRVPASSRFVVDHIQFVHFAISDLSRGRFYFHQDLTRGAFGESGFNQDNRLTWVENNALELLPDGGFRIIGKGPEKSIDLVLKPAKPVVFHGSDGISQKAEGAGRASHYYSYTRLISDGQLRIGDDTFTVHGLSWYDHEWATNQLTAGQKGWDWFSLQFDDGSELMLFQIRTKDGGRDPFSGGTFIHSDGSTTAVKNSDFVLTPGGIWKSKASGGNYPVTWGLEIESLDLNLAISARLDSQELVLTPISYWEGSIQANGTRDGRQVTALGYLEMTGYAGPIVGMQAPAE
jgi:predicted secreted hydrolase